MRLVILESPYAGDVALNLRYARACVADCFTRGEAAIASHLLYTQEGILDDGIPEQRALGIAGGFAWAKMGDASVVYTDLGTSNGMRGGVRNAEMAGRPIEYRKLPEKLMSAVRAPKPPQCAICRGPMVDLGPVRCIKCPRASEER